MATKPTTAAIGYLRATQRDCCGNCQHIERTYVDRSPPWDRAGWACGKHKFATTRGAICNEYQADKRLGPPPL